MKKLVVLTTGGTIEKIYIEKNGTLVNQGSIIKDHLLNHLRIKHTQIEVVSLFSKDSLDLTDSDRQQILDSLKRYSSMDYPIIVLHGTDTLEVSARFCWEKFPEVSVPVVFTGAMRPLGLIDSDAGQNFLEALTAAKILSAGYYVTFHSGIFDVPNVTKDRGLGTFVKTT